MRFRATHAGFGATGDDPDDPTFTDATETPGQPISKDFAIAWSNLPVPEPAGLLPLIAIAIALLTDRRSALRFRRPLITC